MGYSASKGLCLPATSIHRSVQGTTCAPSSHSTCTQYQVTPTRELNEMLEVRRVACLESCMQHLASASENKVPIESIPRCLQVIRVCVFGLASAFGVGLSIAHAAVRTIH
jgi:hypothetical protein